MTLVVAALAVLLIAWRFIPDRLPSALRPSALIGVVSTPKAATAPQPAPPESQFDE
jgi:hypothetical protein